MRMNGYLVQLLKQAEMICDTIAADIKYYTRLKNRGMLSQEDEEERYVTLRSHTHKLDRIWCEYSICMNDPYHVPRV